MMGSLAFNREKMNDPTDEEGPFREEWLRYYQRAAISIPSLSVAHFLDPSAKNGESNDFKACITVGLDRARMSFCVLHAWIRHASIKEMFAEVYRLYGFYGGTVGIEENMLEDFLHEAIANYAREAGRYLPWKAVKHTANKESRIIGTLSYLVEHGKIEFEKGQSDQNVLIEQLIYFLSGSVHDDGPDALEGAVSLLQDNAGAPWEYQSLGKTAFSRVEGCL
jgi:predicted phage terminase large subunit-like protein